MIKKLSDLLQAKAQGNKLACLTAYDASFARMMAASGVDLLLVGDSLGMVVQGHNSTLPVTVSDMVYHAQLVRRGAPESWIIVDMPFMSVATLDRALTAAQRLMQEGQANMVKLEGDASLVPIVEALTMQGVPVCAHIGLLPQQAMRLGYKRCGKTSKDAEWLLSSALALEASGVSLIVLECVEPSVATQIGRTLTIPTIGIGSGAGCDGQVLVMYDMLGLSAYAPSFAPSFLTEGRDISQAIAAYVAAVKSGHFPEEV
jgi:3-methyl-2-oxobutanoate hydroxymethyltransferase